MMLKQLASMALAFSKRFVNHAQQVRKPQIWRAFLFMLSFLILVGSLVSAKSR